MPTPLDILAQARGYMVSRVILTAAELDLFTRLASQPATADEIAAELGLDRRGLTRLLDCLITQDLLEKKHGRYRVTKDGAHLASGHRPSILPMVQHLGTIWDNWSQLTECVRSGGNPRRRVVSGSTSDQDTRAFIGAMHVAARPTAGAIAKACDLRRFSQLLDIGGGSGAYTIAFLKKRPSLRALLFDLPSVIRIAEDNVVHAGLRDRVAFVAGDFYKDKLPSGCDLALLSAIIHQNSPRQNLDLYAKVHRALKPGGVLLIRDHVMDESRTKPPDGALFALNMLVNTPGGDTYTFTEIADTLQRAGFVSTRLLRSGERMDCVVEAKKR
ncbi:MAG: methyltransferase [Candidatus Binatia bacterium]|jgi:SAM-dependent methyltransferase